MSAKTRTAIVAILISVALVAIAAVGFGLWSFYRPKFDPATQIRSPQITGEVTYAGVKEGRTGTAELIGNLTADGHPMIYDAGNDIYYLSVADEAIGNDTGIAFAAESTDGSEVKMVFRDTVDQYSWFRPENNREYLLRVYSDTEYQTAVVVITTMPFLSIETKDGATIGNDDTECSITLLDGNWEKHGTAAYTRSAAHIHVRGATSRSYPKKPYRINLKTDDYTEQNKISLLGLRVDDDWILDAMYIDPTRMHNNLATEIWNTMSKGHYPTNNSPASKGEYVEVILNGEYVGLYDLLEPVDRKQLDMDPEKGLIVKANGWNGTYFEKTEGYPTSAVWMEFEVTYPKENVTTATWGDFYDLVEATSTARKDPEYFELWAEKFDAENITDYWLWLTVFSLRDNRGKNLYWSTLNTEDKNAKYYITPWDCDLSFGYRYGKREDTLLDLQHHRDPYENDYIDDFRVVTEYLRADLNGSRKMVQSKWKTLTAEGGVLNLDSVLQRIRQTRKYLNETGAWARELERWPDSMNPDPDEEFEYMEEWLAGRYQWMEGRIEEMMNGFEYNEKK